ncbi:DUF805 domain-containing protein [Pseudonocardia xinjiangensis]|uniref:DUF805 domain-containing protein n=1 Tax=Pseudonocardia xinjiangensis TaxID=75289 RepID=UPI003D8A3FFB
MQWYTKVLRQYVNFGGRARRTEFWMFILFSVIVGAVLRLGDALLFSTSGQPTVAWLSTIYGLAVALPTLAVGARRLHDTGRSGWWQLLAVIPVIGAIVLIVFYATAGEPSANKYGPDPKALPADYLIR